jgi:hypothetical protein
MNAAVENITFRFPVGTYSTRQTLQFKNDSAVAVHAGITSSRSNPHADDDNLFPNFFPILSLQGAGHQAAQEVATQEDIDQ